MKYVPNTEPTVYTCDDTGGYYICPICKRKYRDEMNAALCCLTDNNNKKKGEKSK